MDTAAKDRYSATAFHDCLRRSPGLSDAAVRLALTLSGYADTAGSCWPSQPRLAADIGWSVRKTKRVIKELREFGVIEYRVRARHQGEKSTIQLRTGVTVGTGDRTCTGAKNDNDRCQIRPLIGVIDGPQNSPIELPQELTQSLTGADASAPHTEGPSVLTAQQVVAYATEVASEAGITLTANRKNRIGKEAKALLLATPTPKAEHLLAAVEVLVRGNRPPSELEYILGDLQSGGNGNGKLRGRGRTDPREGRSQDGEY